MAFEMPFTSPFLTFFPFRFFIQTVVGNTRLCAQARSIVDVSRYVLFPFLALSFGAGIRLYRFFLLPWVSSRLLISKVLNSVFLSFPLDRSFSRHLNPVPFDNGTLDHTAPQGGLSATSYGNDQNL